MGAVKDSKWTPVAYANVYVRSQNKGPARMRRDDTHSNAWNQ